MRVFFSPKTWLGVGCVCLSTIPMMGCKSTGTGSTMGWLSWFSPRPSANALSSTPPTKPSVATLPNPGTTTGATPTSLASFPAGHGAVQATGGQAAAGGYFTGPYGMSGSTANQANAGSASSPYASGYGSPAPQLTGQAPSYGGYQSPHAAATNGLPRMADSRSAYGGGYDNALKSVPYAGQPAAGNSLNSGAYAPAMGGGIPVGYNDPAPPRGIDLSQSDSGTSLGGSWTPPASSLTPGNSPDRLGGASATSATPAAAPGLYRPGSTGRNNGALPTSTPLAAQPLSAASGAVPVGGYPTTGYPSTNLNNSLPSTAPSQFR